MVLPLRKYKLTSQNQPYTALIDWLEIYDSYVNSNLTYNRHWSVKILNKTSVVTV